MGTLVGQIWLKGLTSLFQDSFIFVRAMSKDKKKKWFHINVIFKVIKKVGVGKVEKEIKVRYIYILKEGKE